MKNIYTLAFIVLIIAFAISSCVKDDHFGKSGYNNILYFTVKDQVGVTNINRDSMFLKVVMPNAADLSELVVDSINLSSYASSSLQKGQVFNGSETTDVIITAENGEKAIYSLKVAKETLTPQLDNSDFSQWYLVAGKDYKEPGLNETSTIWATGNAGTVTLGSANAVPITYEGKTAVQLKTLNLLLGQLLGQGMAAGTIFTGKFELNISDPIQSTKFGIPFVARPKGFSVKYAYTPGAVYKNGFGTVLDKADSCDMYVLLEHKSGNLVKRVATAWFRDGQTVGNLTEISASFVYGSLPSDTPSYQIPAGGFAAAGEEINQITVVFSSSAYGAMFEGGVNSTLIVTDFKLIY
jgi:hypothetical protein